MKTIFITITWAISTLILQAQSEPITIEDGTTIKVTVPVQNASGTVVFGLFDKNNFLKNPIQSKISPINNGEAIATFIKVIPGPYAIVLFHDKNDNKILDFDENGIPTENYGVSNNMYSYGPPQWHDAKFDVQDQAIEMFIYL